MPGVLKKVDKYQFDIAFNHYNMFNFFKTISVEQNLLIIDEVIYPVLDRYLAVIWCREGPAPFSDINETTETRISVEQVLDKHMMTILLYFETKPYVSLFWFSKKNDTRECENKCGIVTCQECYICKDRYFFTDDLPDNYTPLDLYIHNKYDN